MDTRFWGPDGWLILHSITYHLPEKMTKKDNQKIKEFFTLTSKLLPCKYCRISMQKFIKQEPIDTTNREHIIKWLFKIHNKVNNKLRRQGYCITKNPSFKDIDAKYKKIKEELQNDGEFSIEYGTDEKVKRTKTIKKEYRNFDDSIKKRKYTKQELLLCNNYIGSLIFNFSNYISNNVKSLDDKNLEDIIENYETYLNLLCELASSIDKNISDKIKNYINQNKISKIIVLEKKPVNNNNNYNNKLNKSNVAPEFKIALTIKSKINLYKWYFKLCKKINNNLNNKINIDKFCNKFNKYIVKTCSDMKTVNEKTKKLNTCRKQIK